ncbi:probable G-protein coupled receptor Mth-like 1 [Penaeus monodon]|uniref:probable G-protein coupled receptor Mth-like 1 n=1 Tax=Penaeus monodon TaxID=6687 RepID=UPI0018A7617E|nr:probable G-protein coupled receptor Mth-like 1 [Penaeus monodon]
MRHGNNDTYEVAVVSFIRLLLMTFEVHFSLAVMQGRHRWSWLGNISLLLIMKLAPVCLGEAQTSRACCEEGAYPDCGYAQGMTQFTNFSVQPSGDLLLFGEGASNHSKDEYCIADCFYNLTQGEPKYVWLCRLYKCWWKFYVLDPLLLSVSSVFLAVSLIVYVSVAELRGKESNCPLMCMLSAQLLSFASTLVIRILRSEIPDSLCRFLVLLNTFAVLATFAWLNVVCYEVWTCVPQFRDRMSERKKKRWWLFSLYGWGFPFVWTTVAGVIDLFLAEDHVLHPSFVRKQCYFKDSVTVWFYRNGPMLLMMLVNLYLFVRLVNTLLKQFRDIDLVLQTTRRPMDRYKLFIRLFMVMGIAWCLEFFTHTDKCPVWVVLCELVVELQGLWIFFVTTCAQNNRRLILRSCGNFITRFSFVRGCAENRRGTTGTERDTGSTSNTTEARNSVLRNTDTTQLPDVPGPPCISSNIGSRLFRSSREFGPDISCD